MSKNSTTLPQQMATLGIANFKAFGPHLQNIPLRPITLIFGPNSSGKSSLLHFLLWMKDVINQGRLDVVYPSASGHAVDLGGFKQIRHGTDAGTELKSSLELEIKTASQQVFHVKALSVFATCQPPTDYARRLGALVRERFEESRSRNTLEKMLQNITLLEEQVIRYAFKKLLSEEYGESALHLRLNDCFESTEQHMRSISDLRKVASPKLNGIVKRNFDLFSAEFLSDDDSAGATLRETAPLDLSETELVLELQSLASAVFDELNHHPETRAEGKPSLVRFELRDSEKVILTAAREGGKERRFVVETLDFEWLASFSYSKPDAAQVALWKASFESCVGSLVFDETGSWLPKGLPMQESPAESLRIDTTLIELAREIEGTPEAPGLLAYCDKAARARYGEMSYLAPIRVIPPRRINVAELPDQHDAFGWHAWRRLYEDTDLRCRVSNWLQHGKMSPGYEIEIDHHVNWSRAKEMFAAEFGKMNAKFWRDVDSTKQLDNNGDELGRFRADFAWNPDSYLNTDAMVQEALKVVSESVVSQANATIFLRDLRSLKEVSSRDIGVGVSQLVPVLVRAMDAKNEIIAIEQPEIHLHPWLQAELGDEFIKSAMTRGNSFVLETHSEHLILRILRRIRETDNHTLAADLAPIRPADVAVLFIEPGENGSKVMELPVTKDGDFDKPWPGGFFTERGAELF
jgi:ABC-type polar amino acid transport system ATPase subunit